MTSWWRSPAFTQSAANGTRTRRILAAIAVSALAHALLISGAAVGPAGKRPGHVSTETLSVTLSKAQPVSPEQELHGSEVMETGLPARHEREEPGEVASDSRERDKRDVNQELRRKKRLDSRETDRPRPEPPARVAARASDAVAQSPDTTYYTIRQLDIFPAPTQPLQFPGLTRALAAEVRARAVVELHISETGVVDDAKVIEAHPSGYFESELAATFLAVRFTPAVRDGRTVRSRVLVRIE
jgi:TonB family protein